MDDAPLRIEETALEAKVCSRNELTTRVILRRETLEDRNHTVIKQRLKAAIITTPNFNPDTQAENFNYNLFVLFMPFRSKNQLIQSGETAEAAFIRAKSMDY